MKSFVDNFTDNRIAIETLERMIKVNYQRDALLELAIENYHTQNFDINIFSQYILKLENIDNMVFILLSSNMQTLDIVNEKIKTNHQKPTVIVFDQTDKFNTIENKVFVSTKEWMNRIISHGINSQILDLQYLRDLDYHYV